MAARKTSCMLSREQLHTATRLLNRLGDGDPKAAEELSPLIHRELWELASFVLQGPGARATLQPTELVHEAWIRFAGKEAHFENRHQFFALAAKVMRSVLVDHARARNAHKRGGGERAITLAEEAGITAGHDLEVLDLDEALKRLEAMDPELSQLVELRFFAGLSHPEIAGLTGVPLRTVERRWQLARAWLRGELAR